MTSVSSSVQQDAKGKGPKDVVVVFNKQTIEIPKGEHTGAEIKAFAIEQGVRIESSFPLAVRHGNQFNPVGDSDVVKVHEHMEFTAIAGDDNS